MGSIVRQRDAPMILVAIIVGIIAGVCDTPLVSWKV
jgi:hypothetical protein